jgi:hypothetical protein
MKKNSIINYTVLILILFGGVVSFYTVRSNPTLQLMIGVVTSVSYVLWGIIHHYMDRSLHKKIVIEYLLIGAIAIVLLATVIKS